MKITNEMMPYLEKAMEYKLKKAYPKTGGASVRERVFKATLEGISKMPENTVTLAFEIAVSELSKKAEEK